MIRANWWWVLVFLGGLAGGCATPSSSFEDGFGDAVREAMREQTWDEGEDAPALRGTKAEEAIDRYHAGDGQGRARSATTGLRDGD